MYGFLGTRLQMYCVNRAVPVPLSGTRLQMGCANQTAPAHVFGTGLQMYCVNRASYSWFGACCLAMGHAAPNALCKPRGFGACLGHGAPNALCKPRWPGACLGTRLQMYCANVITLTAPFCTPLVIRRVAPNCSISMGKAQEWVWHLVLSLSYPHQTLPDI